ncbi:MAG: HAD-IIIC family phosphatase [Candidatus Bathyarchaeum sp.]|nr:MAG: HAD-IIIC family phosphatase [Candidatus Bathyarchaeum sp.]
MDSKEASQKQRESTSSQLEKLLNQVQKEPTHLNYWNVHKRIQKLDLESLKIPDEKRIKVALLSSFTIDPLCIYLDIKSRFAQLHPEIYVAPFNQYQQEILNENSRLYTFKPDVIILAVQADVLLSEHFFSEFVKLSNVEQYQTEIVDRFQTILSMLTARTDALVLVNNFIVPSFTPFGILDNKADNGFRSFFYELNQRLAELYKKSSQVYVVDLEGAASKHGKSRCLDPKLYYRGSLVFSESFLPVIADEYMAYIKALKNLTRKCIVLDLDNVMWGGIIGEDGIEGIQLGNDSPGNVYKDFQRVLLSYYNRGILLAINSKNNPEDALKAIREHPHMLLREKHFVAIRINWRNKVQNMTELAKEINIGLDSMAFMDDNPREREQMKQALPQVLVVDLPSSPFLYRQTLENLNDFNVLALTEEDKKRGEMYHARKKREELRTSISSLEDFLKSLEMKIVIKHADDLGLPRIVRMVNKTNQFNLTTRRYTDAEIRKMKEAKNEFVIYSLQVSDKLGDEGIVGVAIIRKEQKMWTLDSFLLSCRVIGRKVETAFLAKIVADAKEQGVSTLVGECIPTQKNAPVKNFYSSYGFEELAQEGNLYRWRLDLTKSTVKMPEWMNVKNG